MVQEWPTTFFIQETDELDKSTSGEVGTSKKSKKAQEAAAANDQVAPALQAKIKAVLCSAQEAAAEAKGKADQAASDMFQLYANLLSVDAKFAWNKIVHKQTATDTYTDLQGCTKKGPRGLTCKSFDDCMTFLCFQTMQLSRSSTILWTC